MVTERKPTGKAMSMPGGLAVGAVWSLAITILGAMLVAKLVDSRVIGQGDIGYGSLVILLLSSLVGALTAWRKIKRQRAVVCMLSGAIYYGLLLGMTALFFGGRYTGMGVTALVVLCGSMVAVLMGINSGRGGGKRNAKIRNR